MSFNCRGNPNEVPDYLNTLIKLGELQKMTDHLDNELADSQKIMTNIKTMFDSIPNAQNASASVNSVKQEDFSKFLVGSPPHVLMEDMAANTADVDLDVIINTMKAYVEDLRKTFVLNQPQIPKTHTIEILDLDSYVSSLDQLAKRLANVKLNKHEEASRNAELEAKLDQLCKDVNIFTQMIEAKRALTATNTIWTPIPVSDSALYYDNIINKLLAGINEVTYLLKNKN